MNRGKSPYEVGPPLLASSLYFFGRDDEVDRIVSFTRESRIVTLHGPRRSGKTTVLNRVVEQLRGAGFPIAHVDATELNERTIAEVERGITTALHQQFPEFAPIALDAAKHRLPHDPVLILDEAETLDQDSPELLEALLQRAIEARWRLVMTVGRTVGQRRAQRRHLLRTSRSVDLEPFGLAVVDEAVRVPSAGRLDWTDAAIVRIQTLSGGLPLLVNALADELWRTHEDAVVDVAAVEAVAEAVVGSLRGPFEYVWLQGTGQRRRVGWTLSLCFGAGCEEPCVREDVVDHCAQSVDRDGVTAALHAFADNWLVRPEGPHLRPAQPLFWRFVRSLGEDEATAAELQPDANTLQEAVRAAEAGDWPAVRRHCDAILGNAPQDAETLILRARSMWHTGGRAQAIAQLRTLLDTRREPMVAARLRDWLADEALQASSGNLDRAVDLLAECRALDPDLESPDASTAFLAVECARYAALLRQPAQSTWGRLTQDVLSACPHRLQQRLVEALCKEAFRHFDGTRGLASEWLAESAPHLASRLPILSETQAILMKAAAAMDGNDPKIAAILRERADAPGSLHAGELVAWGLRHLERAPAPERALAALAGVRGGDGEPLRGQIEQVLRAGRTNRRDLPALARAVRDGAPNLIDELLFVLELAAADETRRDPILLQALLELPEPVREAARWRTLALAVAKTITSGLEPAQIAALRAALRKDLPPHWADDVSEGPATTGRPREFLQQLLGTRFQLSPAAPRMFRIAGAADPSVLIYEGFEVSGGAKQTERVSIRVFDLGGTTASQRRLLEELWANEQRSLYSVGLRTAGRALIRLRHAVSGAQAHDLVLAITDDLSRTSLRAALDRDHRVFSDRKALWRSLAALYEGVRALHHAGCMHRAVRPESVLVVDEALQVGGEYLRLANFEFSVYVTSLARRRPPGAKWVDRYSPPAAVYARLSDAAPGGESLTGDVFGLALLTFELLVRPFTASDLVRCFVAEDYDEGQHRAWLEGLRVQVAARRAREEITPREALVFKALLDEALEGGANLDEPLRLARECATMADLGEGRRERFVVTTTTNPNRDGYFGVFLQEELGEEFRTEQDILRFLREDLRGAHVYAHPDPNWRLLIHGRRLAYRARPYIVQAQELRHVAFLEVARVWLPPRDVPLARLTTVEPVPMSTLHTNLHAAHGSGWEALFAAASGQTAADADSRRLLGLLRLSLDLEIDVHAQQVYKYKQLERLPAGDREERVRICDAGCSAPIARAPLPLAHFLRQLVDYESPRVDLSRRGDPTAGFHPESAWTIEKADDSEIVLRRVKRPEAHRPPTAGFLRPLGLAGTRTLVQRRRALLERLSEDEFLLRALNHPQDGYNLGLAEPPPIQDELDANKRTLARAARNWRPLVLVQGPPGTGKTTLATEVILEALRDDNARRILVTAQSHDPLNNMLLRIEDRIRDSKVPALLAVRLMREDRLDPSRWGAEAAQIGRQYSPGEIARRALEAAAAWSGDGFPRGFVEMFQARANELARASTRTIADRVISAANIVYTTTNDRSLFELQDDSFDLVLVEEAARALPLELLAPMSLGRRWLLIGDHQQLPPYGLNDLHDALTSRIKARNQATQARRQSGGASLPLGSLGFESTAALRVAMHGTLELFRKLHGEASAAGTPGPAGALEVQWRMHPRIGAMLNEFYPELRTGSDEDQPRWHHPFLGPGELARHSLVWIDMPHCSADESYREKPASGGGFTNAKEIVAIRDLLVRLVRRSTGRWLRPHFLSPYRAQVNLFRRMSERWSYPATEPITADRTSTVDGFQGRQASAIILSLVRNNEHGVMGFLDSVQRATVAFSRAESLLVVVGCGAQVSRQPDGAIRKIYEHISEHGLLIPYDRLCTYPFVRGAAR